MQRPDGRVSIYGTAVRLCGEPANGAGHDWRSTMPLYAAINYTPDLDWTAPENADEMAAYGEFGEHAAAAIRGGAALFPTATATTVRVTGGRGGEVVVSDGPYADTKEVLAGFFLLECDDIDQAIELAGRIPAAWNGAVEVRPVIPM
jgi:hypothetical protein